MTKSIKYREIKMVIFAAQKMVARRLQSGINDS